MRQLINHVECRRWYSYFSNTVWHINNIRALQICIPFEPFLQSGIINRIVHDTREEMQFNRYIIHCCFKMMIPYIITNFKMLLGIFRYLFTACIHPYINIPWISRIHIWIHQGIPLSFQYAASQSVFSKHRIEFACYHIHLHVLSANLLCRSHPSHQQFPLYRVPLQLFRIFLPQSLDTVKTKSKKSLLGSKGV